MWTTIGIVVLGLAALLLLTPLELTLRCERRTKLRCRVGFRWLFGAVRHELQPERPAPAEEFAPVEAEKRHRRRKVRRRTHVVAMLRSRGFLRGVIRLLGRLRNALEIREHFVFVRAGLEDPADTGVLCSWLLPLAAWFRARHPGHWDLAPEFSGPTFRVSARGRLSVVPARLLWPLLVFGLSPAAIRGFVALRTGRIR